MARARGVAQPEPEADAALREAAFHELAEAGQLVVGRRAVEGAVAALAQRERPVRVGARHGAAQRPQPRPLVAHRHPVVDERRPAPARVPAPDREGANLELERRRHPVLRLVAAAHGILAVRVQVDEPRRHDEPGGVDDRPALQRRCGERGHRAVADPDMPHGVEPALRIDDPPAGDHQVVRLGSGRGRQRGRLAARACRPRARGGQQQQAEREGACATGAAPAAAFWHRPYRRGQRNLRLRRDSHAHRGPSTTVQAARLRLPGAAVKAGQATAPRVYSPREVGCQVGCLGPPRARRRRRPRAAAGRAPRAGLPPRRRGPGGVSRHPRPRPADGNPPPRAAPPGDPSTERMHPAAHRLSLLARAPPAATRRLPPRASAATFGNPQQLAHVPPKLVERGRGPRCVQIEDRGERRLMKRLAVAPAWRHACRQPFLRAGDGLRIVRWLCGGAYAVLSRD